MDTEIALKLLHQVYDADTFRKQGGQIVDLIASHLETTTSGDLQVFPWLAPEESLQFWSDPTQFHSLTELFQQVLEKSVSVHHPHYIGHQVNPAVPVAIIAGALSDFLSNGMGIYEMGMVGTAMEKYLAKQITTLFGMGADADGFLTSGGSLANLTALLTAHSAKVKDSWTQGTSGQLAVMVSEQAHYCVDRAVRIMGWGASGVIKIPANDSFQMRTDLLAEYLERAAQQNITVIAVVGSACSTSTGSFDDLNAIADFCADHDLWLHVDGAHGAAVVFSEKYRHLLAGIDRADSVAMDFHKLCMVPAITSGLFFRNQRDSYQTFAQQADYLWSETGDEEWFNIARRSFECTKTMMVLKIYSMIALHGYALFEANVLVLLDLAQQFADLIRSRSDFELATDPQCNIVCFRYKATIQDSREISTLNQRIREQLLKRGEFYIVQTKIRGETWLRCTVTNPLTTSEVLSALLDAIEIAASEHLV